MTHTSSQQKNDTADLPDTHLCDGFRIRYNNPYLYSESPKKIFFDREEAVSFLEDHLISISRVIGCPVIDGDVTVEPVKLIAVSVPWNKKNSKAKTYWIECRWDETRGEYRGKHFCYAIGADKFTVCEIRIEGNEIETVNDITNLTFAAFHRPEETNSPEGPKDTRKMLDIAVSVLSQS